MNTINFKLKKDYHLKVETEVEYKCDLDVYEKYVLPIKWSISKDLSLHIQTEFGIFYLHRIILGLVKGDFTEVDHIDGTRTNFCRSNLREVTSSQNKMNRIKPSYFTSKYKGICWYPRYNKWQVEIQVERKRTYIGRFTDETEAAKAYDNYARKLHGEFARLNFPLEGEQSAISC